MPIVKLNCKSAGSTAGGQPAGNYVVDVVYKDGQLLKIFADGTEKPVEGLQAGGTATAGVSEIKNGSGTATVIRVLTPTT